MSRNPEQRGGEREGEPELPKCHAQSVPVGSALLSSLRGQFCLSETDGAPEGAVWVFSPVS